MADIIRHLPLAPEVLSLFTTTTTAAPKVASMSMLSIMFIPFITMCKVLACSVVGVFAVKMYKVPQYSLRGMSFITLRVLVPCLLFTRLSRDLSWTILFRGYYWAVVLSLIPLALGFFFSYVVFRPMFTGPERRYRILLVLSCTFQDALGYGLSIVQNLKGVSWFGRNKEELNEANTVVIMYNVMVSIFLGTTGMWLIRSGRLADQDYKQRLRELYNATEADNIILSKFKALYYIVTRTAANNEVHTMTRMGAVPAKSLSPLPGSPSGRSLTGGDNDDEQIPVVVSPPSNVFEDPHDTAVPRSIAEQLPEVKEKYSAIEKADPMTFAACVDKDSWINFFFVLATNVPVIFAFWGVVFALIPALQHFAAHNPFGSMISGAIEFLSRGAVPMVLINLGANIFAIEKSFYEPGTSRQATDEVKFITPKSVARWKSSRRAARAIKKASQSYDKSGLPRGLPGEQCPTSPESPSGRRRYRRAMRNTPTNQGRTDNFMPIALAGNTRGVQSTSSISTEMAYVPITAAPCSSMNSLSSPFGFFSASSLSGALGSDDGAKPCTSRNKNASRDIIMNRYYTKGLGHIEEVERQQEDEWLDDADDMMVVYEYESTSESAWSTDSDFHTSEDDDLEGAEGDRFLCSTETVNTDAAYSSGSGLSSSGSDDFIYDPAMASAKALESDATTVGPDGVLMVISEEERSRAQQMRRRKRRRKEAQRPKSGTNGNFAYTVHTQRALQEELFHMCASYKRRYGRDMSAKRLRSILRAKKAQLRQSGPGRAADIAMIDNAIRATMGIDDGGSSTDSDALRDMSPEERERIRRRQLKKRARAKAGPGKLVVSMQTAIKETVEGTRQSLMRERVSQRRLDQQRLAMIPKLQRAGQTLVHSEVVGGDGQPLEVVSAFAEDAAMLERQGMTMEQLRRRADGLPPLAPGTKIDTAPGAVRSVAEYEQQKRARQGGGVWSAVKGLVSSVEKRQQYLFGAVMAPFMTAEERAEAQKQEERRRRKEERRRAREAHAELQAKRRAERGELAPMELTEVIFGRSRPRRRNVYRRKTYQVQNLPRRFFFIVISIRLFIIPVIFFFIFVLLRSYHLGEHPALDTGGFDGDGNLKSISNIEGTSTIALDSLKRENLLKDPLLQPHWQLPRSRIFQFVILFESCAPSAINCLVTCAVFRYRHHQYAQLIFVVYLTAIFTTSLWLSFYLWYLSPEIDYDLAGFSLLKKNRVATTTNTTG